MTPTPRQAWLAAALACLLLPAAGRAELQLVVRGAGKALCADGSGAAHPKRAKLRHPVPPDATATSALLLLQYTTDASGNAGQVDAKVKVSSLDGSRTASGKLGAATDAVTGVGEASNVVSANLETEAVATWNFRFKKFDRLPPRDCIVIFGAVGPDGGDTGDTGDIGDQP